YRERGVLRRISTTPVSPAMMLVANRIVFVVTALGVPAGLLAIGKLAFDVDVPQQLPGYALVYLLSLVAMLSLGLLVADVVRTVRPPAAGVPWLSLPFLSFARLRLPRGAVADGLLQLGGYPRLGAGVQALTDCGAGGPLLLLRIGVVFAWIVVTRIGAAQLF